MKYSIYYTKTFEVEIEAEDEEQAIRKWEEMDLDPIQEYSLDIQTISYYDRDACEWVTNYVP